MLPPQAYLPTVVDQHGKRAEAEDSQSSEQLTKALHSEGTGVLKGQSRWDVFELFAGDRPGGVDSERPPWKKPRTQGPHAAAQHHQ